MSWEATDPWGAAVSSEGEADEAGDASQEGLGQGPRIKEEYVSQTMKRLIGRKEERSERNEERRGERRETKQLR